MLSKPTFKGIALFTPGGDLVYCIDQHKQNRWHLHLCAVLQDLLYLPEPPHFLVPCYTATVDRWVNPQTQQLQTVAEAYPLAMPHRAVLNAIFGLSHREWDLIRASADTCTPAIVAQYQRQFPQLWESHDLVFQVMGTYPSWSASKEPLPPAETAWIEPPLADERPSGYVLRLFVSGHSATTERFLQTLHQLLENRLNQPYTLKVIDIFKHPEQAELNQVSATPTLVKVWPKPVRRIVGELDDVESLMRVLLGANL